VSLKILLADDSLTAQNMGKKILTEAGYEVIAVSNGAQAMKKVVSDRPDLAVLDVYMPGYTGPELCERMRNSRETARTPVLLSVGKMEAFRPEEVTRVRADGVIIKPFEATELVAMVKKLTENLSSAPSAKRPAKPDASEAVAEVESHAEESEFEIQHQAINIPTEIASSPVIGMELIPEEAREAAGSVAQAAAAPGPIEFEVERDPEPEEVDTSSRMASAAGLSGVFEMGPSAPAAVETPAKPAPAEEFDRFSSPTEAAVASSQAEPAAADPVAAVVAHEFFSDEPQAYSSEVQPEPLTPTVEPETWPTAETSSSEYVVERFEAGEPAASVERATPQPAEVVSELISWNEPTAQAAQEPGDWSIQEPDITPTAKLPPLSSAPELNASASEQAAAVWVAEEAEVEPHESAVSLYEQMQHGGAIVGQVNEPEAAGTPLVAEGAAIPCWEAPAALAAEPEHQQAGPSGIVEAPILTEFEPSLQAAFAAEQPEIKGDDPEPADADVLEEVPAFELEPAAERASAPELNQCDPQPVSSELPEEVAELELEPDAEPASAPEIYPYDPELELADCVVAPEPEPQVALPTVTEAAADPVRIARIVDQVFERFKPELIAAVTRELEKEEQ